MGRKKHLNYRAILMGKLLLCFLLVLCSCGRPEPSSIQENKQEKPVGQQTKEAFQETAPQTTTKSGTMQQPKTTASQDIKAAVPLTERQALDRVLEYLYYPDMVEQAEWIGQDGYAGYVIKTPDGEQYLDSDGNHGGYYLLHLYKVIICEDEENISNATTSVATDNWFEVFVDSGSIVPMYHPDGSLNEKFANGRSGKAEDVDFVDTTYHNDAYGFILTFPENWKEKYVIIESESDMKNNTCVTFYQRMAYDASEIGMERGRLFTVAVYTLEEWIRVKSDIKSMTENLGEIKQGSLVFYFAGPTDVQFDPDNKAEASEYQTMSSDIPGIVRTMSFVEDKALQSGSPAVEYVKSESVKNKALEQAVIKVLRLSSEEAGQTRYYYNFADLDDDGSQEVFVQLVGRFTGGTGGDLGLIFRNEGGRFELLQEVRLIRNPIIISSEKTQGWHDLIVQASGGGTNTRYVRMKFDGKQYPDTSDAEELDAGAKISGKGIINNDIAEEFKKGEGLYLK